METGSIRGRAANAGASAEPAKSCEASKVASGRRPIEVVETYFGLDGRPIKRQSVGAARIARQYDERGNQVEESYFDTAGAPTLSAFGAARIAWRYDERGRAIEAELFGADGAVIARRTKLRRARRPRQIA